MAIHAIRVGIRREPSRATVADAEPSLARGRTAAIVACVAILLLTLGAGSSAMPRASNTVLAVVAGISALVPFALVATTLRGGASPFRAGAALGVGWTGATVIAGFWLASAGMGVAFATGRWSELVLTATRFNGHLGLAGLLMRVAVFAASVELGRAAWRATGETRRSPAARTAWALGASTPLVATIVLLPWFVFMDAANRSADRTRTKRSAATAQAAAADALRGLRALVACHRTLAASRADAGGAGRIDRDDAARCMADASAAGSTAGHWRLRHGTSDDTTGRDTETFWGLAEPADPRSYHVYVTGAGVMYTTMFSARADSLIRRAQRSAVTAVPVVPPFGTHLSPLDTPVFELRDLRRCVIGIRHYAGDSLGLCRTLRPGDAGASTVHVVMRSRIGGYDRPVLEDQYDAVVSASVGSVDTAFTIQLRPTRYAVDGFRSFLVDASGAIHWTADDRPATDADPLVDACELQSSCHRSATGLSEPPRLGN